jgi:hypothetical protein
MLYFTIPPLIIVAMIILPVQGNKNTKEVKLSNRIKNILSNRNIKGSITPIKSDSIYKEVIFRGEVGQTKESTVIKMFDECPNITINGIINGAVDYNVQHTSKEEYSQSDITICIIDTVASLAHKNT